MPIIYGQFILKQLSVCGSSFASLFVCVCVLILRNEKHSIALSFKKLHRIRLVNKSKWNKIMELTVFLDRENKLICGIISVYIKKGA